MANNIIIGSNTCYATADCLFADAGITTENTAIIYLINGTELKSYTPGRIINGITGFEAGKGYYVIAKTEMDLSAYVIPPAPQTSDDMTDNLWYNIIGTEGSQVAFDGTNGVADLREKKILKLSLNNEELEPVAEVTDNNQFSFVSETAVAGFNFPLQSPGNISILYR